MMNLTQQSFFEIYGKNLDEIIDLQDMIIQCNDQNQIPSSIYQIPEKFLSTKKEFMKLITTIQTALFTHYSYYDSYEKLIEQLFPYIKKFFNSDEIYYFSILNKIKLFLYKNGLITIDTIIHKAKAFKEVSLIFAYEIYQERIEDFNAIFGSKESFLNTIGFPNFESFLEFRDKWSNIDPVSISIREDDADKLRGIISKNNLNYNLEIPYSMFEDISCFFKKEDMPKMIDYAAFYGSVNVFKYLLMNNSQITEKTMEFAVYGGSYEIIHILEDAKCPYSSALEASIRIHNNELYDYFTNSVGLQHTNKTITRAVLNYNIKVIKEILQDESLYDMLPSISNHLGTSILGITISQDFPDLTEMFANIRGFNLNKPQESSYTYLMDSCFSRNIDVVKFFVEEVKVDINAVTQIGVQFYYFNTALTVAARVNSIEIINYLLDKGADINLPSDDIENQPIFAATFEGYLEIIKILLPKISHKSKIMNELYLISSYKCYSDVLVYLIQNDNNEDKIKIFSIFISGMPNNSELIEFFKKCYDESKK